jgi:ribosomal protein S27E
MEFVCRVCKVIGNIPEKNLEHPVTKISCQTCGAILLINPEKGNVDVHKVPLKDSLTLKSSSTQPADAFASILSMRHQNIDSKDWPAIAVIFFILIFLIAIGIYFALNPGIMQEPLLSVCK